MGAKIGRIVGLLVVTGFALAVAIAVTAGGWGREAIRAGDRSSVAIPDTPVSAKRIELEPIEITDSYSGMIRPLERFSLGFEVAGRVIALGKNDKDEPLDEGDRVSAGQVLAKLDDRVLLARRDEAKARLKDATPRLEQAQSDLKRADELKRRSPRAITEAKYQGYVTQLAVAEAQLEMAKAQFAMAEKNLEDATLISPVEGVISKRMVNVGESVNPQQAVMEVLQVHDVLLVIGVPEAYVGQIEVGQPARVKLLARNRFRQDRPEYTGEVYRVAEAADDTTSLFEVEIILSNPQGELKPGLIASARITVDRIEGFRVPFSSAVFRDNQTLLFTVDEQDKARRFKVEHWLEQDGHLIVPKPLPEHHTVVVRGQHRLVDGQAVQRVELGGDTAAAPRAEVPVRASSRTASKP